MLCMNNGDKTRTVELAHGRFAHASGALWLPDADTILLADVHLGFGWALRRRGQLGPVQDSAVRKKLFDVVDELRPRVVVFLGDVVHAPRPAPAEREAIEATVRALAERTHLMLVPGNHDRRFRRDYQSLPIELCDVWRGAGLMAVHGDRPLVETEDHTVLGHIHPAVAVVDHAGAAHKMPAFVAGERITILPAFSPLAAGFDVRAGLPIEMGEVRIVAASGKRAVDLGPLARIQRM